MATRIQRAWYVDKLKSIGIVEKGTNATTKDGYTSDWKSITEIKNVRIYTISNDLDLDVSDFTNTWPNIPEQFHETVIFKVIASGYKDKRNMNLDVAQYFDNEYSLGVKEATKFSRSNYQASGMIKPQDF